MKFSRSCIGSTMTIIDLDDTTALECAIAETVGSTASAAIVKFGAPWCGPCKKIQTDYAVLANRYPHVRVYRIDTDIEHDLTAIYNITALPLFISFVNGKPSMRVVGASVDHLRTMFEQFDF